MGDYMSTTIAVSESLREKLKMFGRKGETYEIILGRMIELAERQNFYDRQKFILENEKFSSINNL
jgi:hypothetical protein